VVYNIEVLSGIYLYFTLVCSAYYFMKFSFFPPIRPFTINLKNHKVAVSGNLALHLAFLELLPYFNYFSLPIIPSKVNSH